MSSTWDEVFDSLGNVVSRRERIVTEDVPNDEQIRAGRLQVRALLTAPNVPDWGKAIARFVLMTNHAGLEQPDPLAMAFAADVSDDTRPIPGKPSRGP